MIQLSFTSDWHTPVAIWFDLLYDEKPDEYHQFYGYQYLTEEEAEQGTHLQPPSGGFLLPTMLVSTF